MPGFCKSAPLDEVRKHGHVLTPGRYVGAEAQEDDGEPFEEKMRRLTATLREQQAEAAKLDAAIAANLKELGYGGDERSMAHDDLAKESPMAQRARGRYRGQNSARWRSVDGFFAPGVPVTEPKRP